jgi:DNA replication protein DnaC
MRLSGVESFTPVAGFDWSWPTQIERNLIERALTLGFLSPPRNLVLTAGNGLGKTMIARNLCHRAVLAGYSVAFVPPPPCSTIRNGKRRKAAAARSARMPCGSTLCRRSRVSVLRRQSR